jgi:hypothetical protein
MKRRDVDEIPIQELTGLALEMSAFATSPDPALLLARELGVERLSGPVRERLGSWRSSPRERSSPAASVTEGVGGIDARWGPGAAR